MKDLYRLLAGTLILTLNFSICTGGLLSAAVALASSITEDEAQILSCISTEDYQHSISIEEKTNEPQSRCGGGSECISQVFSSSTDRIFLKLGNAEDTNPAVLFEATELFGFEDLRDTGGQFARAGPLFEDALEHAHETVKRE
ncbi:hypothetical protein KKC44_03090, partial [Patescibacteria group bacterium]|nr:hypothetical protein [Patescibacteria group bacterium]